MPKQRHCRRPQGALHVKQRQVRTQRDRTVRASMIAADVLRRKR